MNPLRSCFFILFFSFNSLSAQQLLKGRVLDASTQKPVVGASVYINNSSYGTTTDSAGFFRLMLPDLRRAELVVSNIGYLVQQIPVSFDKNQSELLVQLKEKIVELESVNIDGFTLEYWSQWGDLFKQILFGRTPYSDQCKILNTRVVRFKNYKTKDSLVAFTTEPMLIRNNALGYLIKYDMVVFYTTKSGSSFTYAGYPFFSELVPENEKQAKIWKHNRDMAFMGSLNHYFRSLYRNQLDENGFTMKDISTGIKNANETAKSGMKRKGLLVADSIAFAVDSFNVAMMFHGKIGVEINPDKMFANRPDLKDDNPFLTDRMGSAIGLRKEEEPIVIIYNGSYYDFMNLDVTGYWIWRESIATLLPLGFYVNR